MLATGSSVAPEEDRVLTLGTNCARVPERLLTAHARGQVLFISGAGTSVPSGLPDFKRLTLSAYEVLDKPVHQVLSSGTKPDAPGFAALIGLLSHKQRAEILRFHETDYDVVLGMLERRIDTGTRSTKVRDTLFKLLRGVQDTSGKTVPAKPNSLHKSLIRLADRGGQTAIVTTNFDRLLEAAAPKPVATHCLGAMPRPGRKDNFSGVLHIHGALPSRVDAVREIVVTDRDFGEFYLRRRVVPDFIYDAARLFHLVLVGYTANDAPMRYLLNAVAADGSRFDDLKERYAFVATGATPEETLMEDWRGRGITPIPYSDADDHKQLATTMQRWADLSPINGSKAKLDALIKGIVKRPVSSSSEEERDLIQHLFRRSSANERQRLGVLVATVAQDIGWMSLTNDIPLTKVAI